MFSRSNRPSIRAAMQNRRPCGSGSGARRPRMMSRMTPARIRVWSRPHERNHLFGDSTSVPASLSTSTARGRARPGSLLHIGERGSTAHRPTCGDCRPRGRASPSGRKAEGGIEIPRPGNLRLQKTGLGGPPISASWRLPSVRRGTGPVPRDARGGWHTRADAEAAHRRPPAGRR